MRFKSRSLRNQYIFAGGLLVVALLLKITSLFPHWIENHYLPTIYRPIGSGLRLLFGWLPFSIGDVLYGCIFGLTIYYMFRLGRKMIKKQLTRDHLQYALLRLATFLLSLYIVFNAGWGLNYNRLGIAYQLQLQTKEYTKADLLNITSKLLEKVNASRALYTDSILVLPGNREIFAGSAAAYGRVVAIFPFLRYQQTSVKSSYFGQLGNYLGFLGYYNPFTGEAQVNVTIPRFMIPSVACHEIAHQLGYASESEANFVGYLAATHSADPRYHYSGYFDLFRYANHELARIDSVSARENVLKLSRRVRGDLDQVRDFAKRTENPLEPVIKSFYDYYLKANQQEQGVRSYNEVVGWLIAYNRKTGQI